MRNWILAVALTVAAPASAQVVLTSGQGVAVTVGADGEAEAGNVHPAALGPHDLEALDQLRIAYKAVEPRSGVLPPVMMSATEATMPDVAPGRIEIVFVVIGEKDSVLVMLNGYDQGLTYRATITARGRTAPTDVCLVIPGRRGYEHWPYAIEKIELTAFSLADWSPEDGVPCK
jgi:hypothetical protein